MTDNVEPVTGKTAKTAFHRKLHKYLMNALNWVPSGLAPSNGGGLTLTVAAGFAILDGAIGDRDVSTNLTMVASTTNFVFGYADDSLNDGVLYWHVDQDDTPPTAGPWVRIAEVTTGASSITTITDKRRTNPGIGFNGGNAIELLWMSTGNVAILGSQFHSSTQRRFQIDVEGKLQWGSGGTALDVALYRSGLNVLKTDDTFDAVSLRINGIQFVNSDQSIPISLVPEANDTRDLGTAAKRYRDVYISGAIKGPKQSRVVSFGAGHIVSQSGATLGQLGTSNVQAWSMPDGSDSFVNFALKLPDDWDGGDITIRWFVAAAAAGSGNGRFVTTMRPVASGEDVNSAGFTSDTDVVAMNGQHVLVAFTRVWTASVFSAGDLMGIRLQRTGADAADTFAGAINLIAAAVEYTALVDAA